MSLLGPPSELDVSRSVRFAKDFALCWPSSGGDDAMKLASSTCTRVPLGPRALTAPVRLVSRAASSSPPPLHFDESTTPRFVDSTPGRSHCSIAKGWSQGRGMYGGVLLAQVARTAQQCLPPTRRLRSINMSFLAPVLPGEVLLTTSILRSGSAVSHVRVELYQDDESGLCATAELTFGSGRAGVAQPAPPRPATALPHDCLPMKAFGGFTDHLEHRWTGTDAMLSGAARPVVQGWVRPRLPATVDAGLVVAMLDSFPPPVWCAITKRCPAASLQLHMQLVRDVVPDTAAAPAHPWFFYESHATLIGGGYSDIQGRLWLEDGTFLGLVTQCVVDFSDRTLPFSSDATRV